jgi:(E)-4-hydroxy-3-methylbut-2-enyl-diphosphate synthase
MKPVPSATPQKKRRKTRPIKVGRLIIGNGFPISVQTMWKDPLTKKSLEPATLERIRDLKAIGCEALRFSVPDSNSVEILGALSQACDMPLIADIHFDYRLALNCLDYPIAKIRINPGNIGSERKVEELIRKAADKNVPIRVGVNAGSLPKIVKGEQDRATAMLKAAEMELDIFQRLNFDQVLFSLKASDVESTIRANLLFSELYDYPLHLGVTEAGPLVPGIVKNTMALSVLLKAGVGDTLRVSLSDSMENEVLTGCSILQQSVGRKGVELVSCPTCGRTVFDVKNFLEQVNKKIQTLDKNITVAVMGCPVNGPGEARHADLGITGAGDTVLIFKQGKLIRRGPIKKALELFMEEVERLK